MFLLSRTMQSTQWKCQGSGVRVLGSGPTLGSECFCKASLYLGDYVAFLCPRISLIKSAPSL